MSASPCRNTCAGHYDCGSGIGPHPPYTICDDGNKVDTDSCTNYCTWARCGDGSVYTTVTDARSPSPLEECDDGNLVDNDGCANNCTLPKCGDGIRNGTEECDDGTANNGPGKRCSSVCTFNAIDGGVDGGPVDSGSAEGG